MTQYTLMIGLFDKTSKVQEVTTIEAYNTVNKLLTTHIGFGTVVEARGIYTHKDGTIVCEPSLQVVMIDTDNLINKDKVVALTEDIKALLNQESVMLTVQEVQTSFI